MNPICLHCVYLTQPVPLEGLRTLAPLPIIYPLCAHHAANPGTIREVHPAETCANFRARRRPPERLTAPEHPDPDARYIALTQRHFAIVDAADYEWLSKYRWFVKGKKGKYYAGRSERGKIILMHREFMKPPPGMVTDHIDGNSLDNRRRNMRNCTPEQNHRNRRSTGNASGYLGVYPYGKRWKALITRHGKVVYTAVFDDKIEAAQARDRKAIELFGPYTRLNFPDKSHPLYRATTA